MLAAVTALSACRRQASGASGTLILFAASSLKDAMNELIIDFEAQNPELTVRPNYASSGQLAIQLAQGIDADIFAAADLAQMEVAQSAGRIEGPVHMLAANELVILTPRGNPAAIQEVADLTQPGLRLLVATPDAPLRGYTEQLLAKIGSEGAEGVEVRRGIMENVVSEEDNARQVVAKIALGEADAAFAYRSDAFGGLGEEVELIQLPPELRIEAIYPIALVEGSSNDDGARRFIAFVLSSEGQATLADWGFGETNPDE